MKVLLTVGIYPPDIGGPATFIPKLAEMLTKKGIQAHVVSLKPNGYAKNSTPFKLSLVSRSGLVTRYLSSSLRIFQSALTADRIFSNGLYLESILALRVLRKQSVAKVVGDPVWERQRNKGLTALSLIEYQNSKLTLRERNLRRIFRFTLNSYSVIACPSRELVDVVKGWGVRIPVVYLPNGVEIPPVTESQKKFDLIFVGRLVPWKNVDLIIRFATSSQLKILIIGSGPLEAELKALAGALNSKCFFAGDLAPSEVIKQLQMSKAFILLSDYEGLSFALLEAMASGLPAIVSNAKGNTEIITDGVDGIVVDLENPLPGFRKASKLVNNESQILNFGQNAKLNVRLNYEVTSQMQKYIELMAL